MPTYDYKCEKCGNLFEHFRNINDDSPVKCPNCEQEATQTIGKGSGILFKGSGFYITDYSKKNSIS